LGISDERRVLTSVRQPKAARARSARRCEAPRTRGTHETRLPHQSSRRLHGLEVPAVRNTGDPSASHPPPHILDAKRLVRVRRRSSVDASITSAPTTPKRQICQLVRDSERRHE